MPDLFAAVTDVVGCKQKDLKSSFVIITFLQMSSCYCLPLNTRRLFTAVKCQPLQWSDTECGGVTERDDCLCYQC